MSKHRLSPYYTCYHNWHTLSFTTSDSSSDERCFLKVLIVLQLTQLAGSIFQSSITLLEKNIFTFVLTSSLNYLLNSFTCPLLPPSSSWKRNSGLIPILKVSTKSFLIIQHSSSYLLSPMPPPWSTMLTVKKKLRQVEYSPLPCRSIGPTNMGGSWIGLRATFVCMKTITVTKKAT